MDRRTTDTQDFATEVNGWSYRTFRRSLNCAWLLTMCASLLPLVAALAGFAALQQAVGFKTAAPLAAALLVGSGALVVALVLTIHLAQAGLYAVAAEIDGGPDVIVRWDTKSPAQKPHEPALPCEGSRPLRMGRRDHLRNLHRVRGETGTETHARVRDLCNLLRVQPHWARTALLVHGVALTPVVILLAWREHFGLAILSALIILLPWPLVRFAEIACHLLFRVVHLRLALFGRPLPDPPTVPYGNIPTKARTLQASLLLATLVAAAWPAWHAMIALQAGAAFPFGLVWGGVLAATVLGLALALLGGLFATRLLALLVTMESRLQAPIAPVEEARYAVTRPDAERLCQLGGALTGLIVFGAVLWVAGVLAVAVADDPRSVGVLLWAVPVALVVALAGQLPSQLAAALLILTRRCDEALTAHELGGPEERSEAGSEQREQ